ncbi:MAG: sulfite exporter TauE/SafE family protein [Nevskia sp.]|nr:sulfite exporter TauE/SafE family protein [Nevskia sp.]
MWVPGSLLTAPALFLAGMTASVHCTLMCGGLSIHHARAAPAERLAQALALTHGGRLLGYAALGAAAGAAGQGILRHLPAPALGRTLQVLAAAGIIAIGAQMALARRPAAACCRVAEPRGPRRRAPALRSFGRGLLWAAVPCGLLYSVLGLAAVSGDAASGALLAGAFGLGGSPLLAAAGWGGARRTQPLHRLRATGWGLMGLGAAGLAAIVLLHAAGPAWCSLPT